MKRLCLDTSAYSHFKRGDSRAVQPIVAARVVFFPVVALGELRTGFRLGTRAEKNEEELRAFLAEPVVAVSEVDDDAASIYADLVVELRRAGTPLPSNDIWIAAIAVRHGATVLTYDRHFRQMHRVGTHLLGDGGPV